MRRYLSVLGWLAALAVTLTLTSGCEFLNGNKESSTPTNPSPGGSGSLDPFVGTFTAAATGAPSATSCNNLRYTVTPTSATTANVTFSATCASNVTINGSGTGSLNGTTLNWNAQGTVSQGTLTCPFVFPAGSNTAVQEGTNAVRINYSGTICGIPVTGSEVVRK